MDGEKKQSLLPFVPEIHKGLQAFSLKEVWRMSEAFVKAGLFGFKKVEECFSMMMLCQAEGIHPALAVRDYNIQNGKPTKKSEAMQRDFLKLGGRIKWIRLDDEVAEAEFSHPQGGTATIKWTIEMARNIEVWQWNKAKGEKEKIRLADKDVWRNYKRAMLKARCVGEGVRTINPGATSGMYMPEEVIDFAEEERPKDVTPKKAKKDGAPKEKPSKSVKTPEPKIEGDEKKKKAEKEGPPEEEEETSAPGGMWGDMCKKAAMDLLLICDRILAYGLANESQEILVDLMDNEKVTAKHLLKARTQEQYQKIQEALRKGQKVIEDHEAEIEAETKTQDEHQEEMRNDGAN